MNNARRKILVEILDSLNTLQRSLSYVLAQEENALSSLPEGLQYSSRAQKMEEAIDDIESAIEYVEEIRDKITSASE